MNPHCRVGRITLKGTNLVAHPMARASVKVAEKLREHTEKILAYDTSKMAGFAIVSWDMDGRYAHGVYFRRDGFVGQTFLPEFVSAVLRRDVAESAAHDVMSGDA
jgi:hypothetical protein